jgi:hypothetical protein
LRGISRLKAKKYANNPSFFAFALGGALALPYISLADAIGPITHLQSA